MRSARRASSTHPQAQALVDQALALWADTKADVVGDRDLQAKTLLDQVVAQYPGTNQAAASLRHLAYGTYLKDMKDQAQAYWDKLFKDYPTSKERGYAWTDQARFLAAKGDQAKALPLLEKVLKEFPKTDLEPDALFLTGDYLWVLRRFKDALAPLERVVAEYPNSTEALRAHYVLGSIRTFQLTDDPNAALPHLAIVIAKEDVDPERVAWCYYMTALCYARLGDYASGVQPCKQVIENYAKYPIIVGAAKNLLKWLEFHMPQGEAPK